MCGHISFSHLVSRSCIHCCLARECSVHAVVAVYISLLHTQLDRSVKLLARSLARSLTRTQALRAAAALSHLAGSLALHITLARSLAHSHSVTQSSGTLTSRWLSRSSHHTLLAFSLARSPVCVPVSLPCVTVCRPGSRSRVCAGSETSRVSGELQLRQYNYNCVSNGHT